MNHVTDTRSAFVQWTEWARASATRITATVQALLGLLLAFGVPLTTAQTGSILTLFAAGLALATGIERRQRQQTTDYLLAEARASNGEG